MSEIRREVMESRNLVIKTDNLLKNLHAELKMLGKRQDEFQTRQWISSAAAYVAFAILAAGGALLTAKASTAGSDAERQRLEVRMTEVASDLDRQKEQLAVRQSASRDAAEVYKLMTTLPGDERLRGVDALEKLDSSRLTALERQALEDRAGQLRREIGQTVFERGKAAFRRNEMGTVVTEMTRFRALNPDPAEAVEAAFFLGIAHNQERAHDQAVPLLAQFVEESRQSKSRDYAMLLLAQSYQEAGQLEKAAEVAVAAIGEYPKSRFSPQLRGRLATVRRLIAARPGAPAQAGPPAGAAATP